MSVKKVRQEVSDQLRWLRSESGIAVVKIKCVLICHKISQDHLNKGSSNFMSGDRSR